MLKLESASEEIQRPEWASAILFVDEQSVS